MFDRAVRLPRVHDEVALHHHMPEPKQLTGGVRYPRFALAGERHPQPILERLAGLRKLGKISGIWPSDGYPAVADERLSASVMQTPDPRLSAHARTVPLGESTC